MRRFGPSFDNYAQKVPLFLPNFFGTGYASPPASQPEKQFSWDQYRRNREYRALIGTMGALAVVWLRMWVRSRYGW